MQAHFFHIVIEIPLHAHLITQFATLPQSGRVPAKDNSHIGAIEGSQTDRVGRNIECKKNTRLLYFLTSSVPLAYAVSIVSKKKKKN